MTEDQWFKVLKSALGTRRRVPTALFLLSCFQRFQLFRESAFRSKPNPKRVNTEGFGTVLLQQVGKVQTSKGYLRAQRPRRARAPHASLRRYLIDRTWFWIAQQR